MLTEAQDDYLVELTETIESLREGSDDVAFYGDQELLGSEDNLDFLAASQDQYVEDLTKLRGLVARFNTVMGDA